MADNWDSNPLGLGLPPEQSNPLDDGLLGLRAEVRGPPRLKRIGPPGVEARRPCTTAWCDQISTPAENQLWFTVPSTDTVLLRLSLVSTNRHVADRSPLPE